MADIDKFILNTDSYLIRTPPTPPISCVSIDFLLVGGGGAGGQSWASYGGGGGGAGGVIYCQGAVIESGIYLIQIGAGGCGFISSLCTPERNGNNSVFNVYTAYGGGGGGYGCSGTGTGYYCPKGCDGASGGGGSRCGCGGTGSQGCNGGCGQTLVNSGGGGGGGYTGVGADAYCTGTTTLPCRHGGDGGAGYSSNISGTTQYYAYGGGGGAGNSRGTNGGGACGGGNGGSYCACPCYASGCPATSYGSGGGGAAGRCTCCSGFSYGGDGCQGVFILRYPTACGYNIIGGTKYLCNGYCIHCFTSDGTLTIN